MPTANLLEDRYRADARCGLQQGHDLVLPHPGERVFFPAKSSDAKLSYPSRGSLNCRLLARIG
jgi:hypothetical protein